MLRESNQNIHASEESVPMIGDVGRQYEMLLGQAQNINDTEDDVEMVSSGTQPIKGKKGKKDKRHYQGNLQVITQPNYKEMYVLK